jgi:predicted nucleotidyltransferase
LNHSSPVVKQYKILKNTEFIQLLAQELEKISDKVVLFGSSARGEDASDSDADMFVLTKEPEAVNKAIRNFKTKRKIQVIIRTPVAYANMESKEPVFFEEINRGITIMERKS